MGDEDRLVIRSTDVLFGPALPPLFIGFSTDDFRPLPVERGAFFLGEKLLVGIFRRTLQRHLGFPRPDALQIRFTPRGLRRGSRGRRGIRRTLLPGNGHERKLSEQDRQDDHRADSEQRKIPPAHCALLRRVGPSETPPNPATPIVVGAIVHQPRNGDHTELCKPGRKGEDTRDPCGRLPAPDQSHPRRVISGRSFIAQVE